MMVQSQKVFYLFILFVQILIARATGTTYDCKTYRNKHVELEVTDVRQSFDTMELNLVNISKSHNYVLLKRNMPILCRRFLRRLSKVEYLWVPNVGLQEIETNSFGDMKKLQSLKIFNNNMTVLRAKTFTDLKQLRFINLVNNSITLIEEGSFQNLNSLEEIDLSRNRITFIEKNWFGACRNLKTINLRWNQLKIVTSDMLKNLNTFQWISLSFASNNLEVIEENVFTKFFYVQELSLRNNSLKELPSDFMRSMKQGQILDVNANQLKCVNQDVVKKFNLVFMTDNPLMDNCRKRLKKIMKNYRIAIY